MFVCRGKGHKIEEKLYTEAEMKKEREAIIELVESYIDDDTCSLDKLYKAIRARGE